MTVVTILGAGGKMGNHVTKSLLDTKKYELRFVEKSEAGQARIREAGLTVMELDEALKGTDVVIFTTPDALVRQISDEVVPKFDPGTKILFLDPAAIAASRVKSAMTSIVSSAIQHIRQCLVCSARLILQHVVIIGAVDLPHKLWFLRSLGAPKKKQI